MSATEGQDTEHKPDHAPARDAREDEAPASESWYKRLRHRLASKLAKALMAVISRLQALNSRLGGGEGESEDRHRAKAAHPSPPKEEAAPAPTAETTAKKPHKVRKALIFLFLILGSGGLGAGAAYTLLSRLIKDQSLAIDNHDQEIRVFQLQEQEQGKKLAEVLRQLEAERKLRTDMETRLVEVEQKRIAAEASAKTIMAEPARPQPSARPEQAVQKDEAQSAKAAARPPSKASSFKPPGTANCSLAGSDPATLRRCIDEYNRK